jgi:hypothetical protein
MENTRKIKTLSGQEVEVVSNPKSSIISSEDFLPMIQRFQEIEEKNKCLRVKFLDWLSNQLLDWSNQVHVVASNIKSPCVIKVEPRTREDSKNYKDNKELQRMEKFLEEERADNVKLRNEMQQLKKQKENQ